MNFFPFKTAILCLVLTPVLYIATITGCQNRLEAFYLQKIQNVFIANATPLLNGSVRIEDQIAKNIQSLLDQDLLLRKGGIVLDVQIVTEQGRIIYPTVINSEEGKSNEPESYLNSQKVAQENFEILNSDLKPKVHLYLSHGAALSNAVLALYSAVSFCILFLSYKRGSRKAEKDRQKQKKLIENLKQDERRHEEMVRHLSSERKHLFENIRILNEKYQKDKDKAKVNEDEMFNEIVTLEEQINSFIELKNSQENEITELKSAIEKYERKKGIKSKRSDFDFFSKRFSALYKNVEMSKKAMDGFMNLTEDLQIKAEEIVFQLDTDPDSVTIKRKVFSGKKHKTTCFEVLFAYNGRLYFSKHPNRTEVVLIGTKNTQPRDMEYLQSL